jgi:hypothetical protein
MKQQSFNLSGLEGSNPLAFLAAVGTLVTLHEAGCEDARLAWDPVGLVPVLETICARDEAELTRRVASALRGNPVPEEAEKRTEIAKKEMESAKTAVNTKRKEISKRRLRGAERREMIERELLPLKQIYEQKRRIWLDLLPNSVPRPELALGRTIDCTDAEYRSCAASLLESAGPSARSSLDLLAAFGTDACLQQNSDRIQRTPFCFVTGSGHQFFLDTARQLLSQVGEEGVHRVLFERWDYRDKGLSMRWDPNEDRRYALMDRDPSPSGARTMWMANLLAYRALSLFPTVPQGSRLAATGWDVQQRVFSWPLWERPIGAETVRSILQMQELTEQRPDASTVRARGIFAVYRAQRIEVGTPPNTKVNFSPGRRIV